MEPIPEYTCQSCRYSCERDDVEFDLECHRYAPRPDTEPFTAFWPGVLKGDCCGEYARRMP